MRDWTITLVDGLDRTVTTTRYAGTPHAVSPSHLGYQYLQGWNERGRAAYGESFRSLADGFRVHDDSGHLLAHG